MFWASHFGDANKIPKLGDAFSGLAILICTHFFKCSGEARKKKAETTYSIPLI
jgi:hypothetical protein